MTIIKIKNKLRLNLLIFKKLLVNLNTTYLYNIYFFNTESFLDYLDLTYNFKFNSKKIISEIQKALPLNIYVQDNNIYELLKNGLTTYELENISKIKLNLQEKALQDLITLIYFTNNKKAFSKLYS
ncbi:MAG: hypothetical protein R3Y29_03305 [bacterium]